MAWKTQGSERVQLHAKAAGGFLQCCNKNGWYTVQAQEKTLKNMQSVYFRDLAGR